jgi:hypothetical protein
LTPTRHRAPRHFAMQTTAYCWRVSAAKVRGRYDEISDMTLWRWLHDEQLGFPQPFRINGRRFWKEPDLLAWERTRAPDGSPEQQPARAVSALAAVAQSKTTDEVSADADEPETA